MSKNGVTFPLSKPLLSREKWTQGVYHSTPRRSSCLTALADRSRPGAAEARHDPSSDRDCGQPTRQ
jgi:hypothetical protein